jgi:hypothetical protein
MRRRDLRGIQGEHGELVEGLLEIKLTCIILDEVPVALTGFHGKYYKLPSKEH